MPRRAERRFDVSRLVALGDGAGALLWDAAGPFGLLAERLGAELIDLSETGSSAREVIEEQLELAVGLRPTTALVSLGIVDAGNQLRAAAEEKVEFLQDLLLETELVVAKLNATGASVLLVKPLALASTPAAWRMFGRISEEAAGEADAPLRSLARMDAYWRTGLSVIARMYGARFVDLADLFARIVRDGGAVGEREIGLPPQAGADDDLFADPLHLSPLGSSLAADLLLERFPKPALRRRSVPARGVHGPLLPAA